MAVSFHTVTEHEAGQRIDNFLLKHFKKVPKSVIYRIVRKGEVRIDKKRVKPDRKLALGEEIRIPPVKVDAALTNEETRMAPVALLQRIEQAILLEDDCLIVLNKPAGVAVHGGSGVQHGLIEVFRQLRPNLPFIELVHRLDRDTSGLLLLAKSRKVLNSLHELLRDGGMKKHYQALVSGQWRDGRQHVTMELERGGGRQKIQVVEHSAKTAESIFSPETTFKDCTLMDVQILTGRMHQIRVQLAQMDHPIIGDDRYGDFALNREYKRSGLKRLFLHAAYLEFMLDMNGQKYRLEAPLPDDLRSILRTVKRKGNY